MPSVPQVAGPDMLGLLGPIIMPGLLGVLALVALRMAVGDRSRRWWFAAGVAVLLGSTVLLVMSARLFLQLDGPRSWVVLMWSELAVLGAATPPVCVPRLRHAPARGVLAAFMLAGSLVVSSVGMAVGLSAGCERRADCFLRVRATAGRSGIWIGGIEAPSGR